MHTAEGYAGGWSYFFTQRSGICGRRGTCRWLSLNNGQIQGLGMCAPPRDMPVRWAWGHPSASISPRAASAIASVVPPCCLPTGALPLAGHRRLHNRFSQFDLRK